MKKIKLIQNQYVILDEGVEQASQVEECTTWHDFNFFYAVRKYREDNDRQQMMIKMHRYIMNRGGK